MYFRKCVLKTLVMRSTDICRLQKRTMEDTMRPFKKVLELMGYSVLVIAAATTLVVAMAWWSDSSSAVARRFAADSLLVSYEPRIAGVTAELLRRSPGYRQALRDMEHCLATEGVSMCDVVPFLVRRDEAIRRDWGEIVTRLSVAGDWGARLQSFDNHRQWRELVTAVGGADVVRYCDPVVEWEYLGGRWHPTDQPFRGVRCADGQFFAY